MEINGANFLPIVMAVSEMEKEINGVTTKCHLQVPMTGPWPPPADFPISLCFISLKI